MELARQWRTRSSGRHVSESASTPGRRGAAARETARALSVLRSELVPFLSNPKHRDERRGRARLLAIVRAPVIRLGLWAGFTHVDYAYVHGNVSSVHVGARCSTMNTVFNVVSGDIWIGEDTYFSHGCYVLTGQHRFYRGRRVGLVPDAPFEEVPSTGNDIRIGRGCYIGANATILANVTIGDHCIIGAGAVVTTDIPSGSFAAGVPAIIKRSLQGS